MHGGGSTGTAAARHASRLAWALGLTATFMIAELVGAAVTGSLALLADAAHMMTDVGGLGLALLAIRFAAREATPQRTFGSLRMEVLPALTNAVVLLLLTIYILWAPPDLLSGPMFVVAVIGLVVDLISMWLLANGSSESLTLKGRVLFIVLRTWILLKQTTQILTEATPSNVGMAAMEKRLVTLPGATAVHDLHVWTVTSGFDSMSCHLVVEDTSAWREVLRQARALVRQDFKIDHVTIQIEDEASRTEEAELHI